MKINIYFFSIVHNFQYAIHAKKAGEPAFLSVSSLCINASSLFCREGHARNQGRTPYHDTHALMPIFLRY